MTRINSTPSRALVALTLAGVMFAATGCSKPDKSKELRQIEALWQNPETRKIKDIPGAERFYREARQFRYDAGEAYNEGEYELSREYAIWSRLRYNTALAIARQYKAKEALDASNNSVAELNPTLTAINQERNKLVAEVGGLERQVAVARRQKADAEKRAAAMKGGGAVGPVNDAAKARQVADRIQQLESARDQAVAVNAEKNAPEAFNRAENQLKSIRTMRAQTPVPYDMILATSNTALTLYQKATREAKGGHAIDVAKKDPARRRADLLAEGQRVLGASNVAREGNTIRMVAPAAFDRKGTTFNTAGRRYVDAMIDLAKSYDEFTISIEAFTSRGDPTENLAVSQMRARKAESAFKSGGVDGGRLQSKGHGQDRIRFPDTQINNDRIEVIFKSK